MHYPILLLLTCLLHLGTPHPSPPKDSLPRIIASYKGEKIYDEVITRNGVRQIRAIEIDTLSNGLLFSFRACLQVQLSSFEIQIRSQGGLVLTTKRAGNAVFVSLRALHQHLKAEQHYQLYVSLENAPFVHFMNLNTKHIALPPPAPISHSVSRSDLKLRMDTTAPFNWKNARKK